MTIPKNSFNIITKDNMTKRFFGAFPLQSFFLLFFYIRLNWIPPKPDWLQMSYGKCLTKADYHPSKTCVRKVRTSHVQMLLINCQYLCITTIKKKIKICQHTSLTTVHWEVTVTHRFLSWEQPIQQMLGRLLASALKNNNNLIAMRWRTYKNSKMTAAKLTLASYKLTNDGRF